MIDLTPLDVRKKRGDFRKILRGYDPVEVDTFLELVEDRLEALVMENLALSEKATRLETSLNALEQREKAVQEALVSAQKLREEVTEQSRREVDLLKRETQGEVDRMRRDALAEIERQRRSAELDAERKILEVEGLIRDRQRSLEEMERNRRKFLKAFRTLLERELDAVEVEEQRLPLEEAPIELELRGWRPPTEVWLHLPGEAEGEEAEDQEAAAQASEASPEGEPSEEPADGEPGEEPTGEAAREPAASAEVVTAGEEPGREEGLPDAETEPAEPEPDVPLMPEAVSEVEGEEDLTGEEEPPREAGTWREELAGGEAVPPGPSAAGAGGELPPGQGPDAATEEMERGEGEPDATPTLPEEPLWLSSLLRREGLGEKKKGE